MSNLSLIHTLKPKPIPLTLKRTLKPNQKKPLMLKRTELRSRSSGDKRSGASSFGLFLLVLRFLLLLLFFTILLHYFNTVIAAITIITMFSIPAITMTTRIPNSTGTTNIYTKTLNPKP